MGGKGRPTLLTETPRDANLNQQTQRCRMLMIWCPQLLVKASSFPQDAEISAFELRSILNKIMAKRKYFAPTVTSAGYQ